MRRAYSRKKVIKEKDPFNFISLLRSIESYYHGRADILELTDDDSEDWKYKSGLKEKPKVVPDEVELEVRAGLIRLLRSHS